MWHVTRDMWHVTCDTWHVTRLGGWTFSQNFGKNVGFPPFRFISEYFFSLIFFCKIWKVAIPNPDQPPYDLTWHIRFSGPKINIFLPVTWLNIFCFKMLQKSSLSFMIWWICLSAGLKNDCWSAWCELPLPWFTIYSWSLQMASPLITNFCFAWNH